MSNCCIHFFFFGDFAGAPASGAGSALISGWGSTLAGSAFAGSGFGDVFPSGLAGSAFAGSGFGEVLPSALAGSAFASSFAGSAFTSGLAGSAFAGVFAPAFASSLGFSAPASWVASAARGDCLPALDSSGAGVFVGVAATFASSGFAPSSDSLGDTCF